MDTRLAAAQKTTSGSSTRTDLLQLLSETRAGLVQPDLKGANGAVRRHGGPPEAAGVAGEQLRPAERQSEGPVLREVPQPGCVKEKDVGTILEMT